MNMKCEVIRDLLPLYVDGVASEESRALIEEHLNTCESCREYCRLLQEEPPEVPVAEYADETASLKKIKRRIHRNQVLLALVIIGFAVGAYAFLNAMHLADYEGTIEENLSYELPEGYELAGTNDDIIDTIEYVRETDQTIEHLTVSYDGLAGTNSFSGDYSVKLDESTECYFSLFDWDNSYSNELICEIKHDQEIYNVWYRCQEKDKKNYYSSCSKQQQEEILAFVRTFDYHRPANEDAGNIFKRLYRNYGVAGLVLLGFTILIFVGFPIGIAIGSLLGSKEKEPSDSVVRSTDLLDSVNRDRKRRGETTIPAINNVQGTSSNNLARRDHSWSSVPDFFIKMFRKK